MIIHTNHLAHTVQNIAHRSIQIMIDLITTIAQKALLLLINNSLLNASTWRFKWKLDPLRLHESWTLFQNLGIEKMDLKVPAWKFTHANMKDSFLKMGCQLISQKNGIQCFFDLDNMQVINTLSKLGIQYEVISKKGSFNMAYPQNKMMIYCPGSGHIFEFRKQTIGYLTLECGFDVTCFYYPGVQSHKENVNRETLESSVECILNHTLSYKKADDIILYGHCIGAMIMIKAALAQKQITCIVDRGFQSITDLVYSSIHKKRLNFFPAISRYLGNLAQTFYDFNLMVLFQKHGKVLVFYSSKDEFVPQNCCDPDGSYLKSRTFIDLKCDHDQNLSSRYLSPEIFKRMIYSL